MDCLRVERLGVIERYLADRLDETDREAFERHFFECDRCFAALERARTVRSGFSTLDRVQALERLGEIEPADLDFPRVDVDGAELAADALAALEAGAGALAAGRAGDAIDHLQRARLDPDLTDQGGWLLAKAHLQIQQPRRALWILGSLVDASGPSAGRAAALRTQVEDLLR